MRAIHFRRSYADDPTLEGRVFELLETHFTGIGARRRASALLGASWAACSTPFVHEKDGRIVSHVGLLEMPFVIEGERSTLGGIHGVCTLESERRRGFFRRIMEELLDHCDGRYETLELATENPEFYEPFGFRIVAEYRFRADIVPVRGRAGFRPFDVERSGDLEQLDRLLTERTSVSRRIGVENEREVFKFSQGADDLYYSKALDCFAVFELQGSRLSLYDVVSREMPSLDTLLREVDAPIDTVDFHFTPDLFDVETTPALCRYDGDSYMVRGPFSLEKERFMIPPPARH
jgi:predicted N-acetyltransferase YhbS